MADPDSFVVLTGGPGAGKTTLVDALAELSHPTLPEAGRGVIRDQMAIDGPALPWKDARTFAEAMLVWELRSYAAAAAGDRRGPLFFDRGFPDIVGYLRLCGLAVPPHMMRAARQFRYRPQAYVLPFWPEIYVQDAERQQSPAEALRTFDTIVAVYRELGYELIEVPRTTPQARARFVLDAVAG